MPIVPAIRACRCIGAYLLGLLDGHLGPIRCSDPVATDAWWSDGAQALHGLREPFERTEGGRPVALGRHARLLRPPDPCPIGSPPATSLGRGDLPTVDPK